MLFQYLFLLVLNGIFLYVLNKYDTFFRAPLYAIYFFSFFFFNILGSCVVFFPELSIYGYHFYYTPDFFYILIIQSISFWLFLPVHLFKTQKLNFHVDNTNFKRILNVTRIFFYVSFLIVGIFILNYGLPPFFKTDLTVGNTLLVQERTDFFSSVSNFWFYEIGFFILPQFITVFLFVNSRINKSIKNQILFYCLLAYSSLLSLSFLHKNPLLFLFFNLFFVQILFFTKKISYFLIIRFSLVFIALILFGYSIALSGNDIESYGIVIWGIANRIFGVYPLQLSVTLKIVEEVGYLLVQQYPIFLVYFLTKFFFFRKVFIFIFLNMMVMLLPQQLDLHMQILDI